MSKHVKTQAGIEDSRCVLGFAGAWLSGNGLDGCLRRSRAWEELAELVAAPEAAQQTSLLRRGLGGCPGVYGILMHFECANGATFLGKKNREFRFQFFS